MTKVARWLTKLAVFATLLWLLFPARGENPLPNCLYGKYTQGNEETAVEPCGPDTKGIGADTDVQAVMRTFEIPPNMVAFQACPGGRFLAMPNVNDDGHFLVRYPSHVQQNYLAPIVHELAHVVQMRDAGNLAALDPKNNSRRIELGADFLAGLAFNIALRRLNGDDFETNLQLAGSYKVVADDHGPPEHRGQAFRRGLTRMDPYPNLTIVEAMRYWNANDYARIRR
ncbi:hypothetical protein [Derxia gummosa]|uniref:Uncharacterized protein n=1 Tax=Derxia gummosa DSM 723 TaxID=1121388 RepID=A0A8B6XCU5_9BURK|nr:hypothetical protein [Derxia gummosa]